MTRGLFIVWVLLLFGGVLAGQDAGSAEQQEPPEEDEDYVTAEYSFNPIQAEKELKVGNFYFKKGSYKAAAQRFEQSIRWNESYAEPYWRLGEVRERLGDTSGAREAYAKYLELEPAGKHAKNARKELARKE